MSASVAPCVERSQDDTDDIDGSSEPDAAWCDESALTAAGSGAELPRPLCVCLRCVCRSDGAIVRPRRSLKNTRMPSRASRAHHTTQEKIACQYNIASADRIRNKASPNKRMSCRDLRPNTLREQTCPVCDPFQENRAWASRRPRRCLHAGWPSRTRLTSGSLMQAMRRHPAAMTRHYYGHPGYRTAGRRSRRCQRRTRPPPSHVRRVSAPRCTRSGRRCGSMAAEHWVRAQKTHTLRVSRRAH